MGYWKSKMLPKIKKLFGKNGDKKAAAAQACKSFDDSKVEMEMEFEERKIELKPIVVVIYEASPPEIKTLVNVRTHEGVKKYSAVVTKFLKKLAKIGFPGAKKASEASVSFGPALVSGPVLFVLEKVSTFVATEKTAASTSSSSKEKEEVEIIEEEKTAAAPVIITTEERASVAPEAAEARVI